MQVYTAPITRMIEEFSKLPGVGRKTAQRGGATGKAAVRFFGSGGIAELSRYLPGTSVEYQNEGNRGSGKG